MKDIKSYVIGFLTCACLFLIMGQTDKTEKNVMEEIKTLMTQNGRFQISTSTLAGNPYVMETTLDTKTGEIIKRLKTSVKLYKKIK